MLESKGTFLVFEETVDNFSDVSKKLRKIGVFECFGKNDIVHARLPMCVRMHIVLPSVMQLYIVLKLHKVHLIVFYFPCDKHSLHRPHIPSNFLTSTNALR